MIEISLNFVSKGPIKKGPFTPTFNPDITFGYNAAYQLWYRPVQGSHAPLKTQGNGLSMENQGNLREFVKLLREF